MFKKNIECPDKINHQFNEFVIFAYIFFNQ